MSSGVTVSDAVLSAFQDLKLKKKYTGIIMALSPDFTEIVVESTSDASTAGGYKKWASSLPSNDCRFGVYDFAYSTKEGPRNKLVFITWYFLSFFLSLLGNFIFGKGKRSPDTASTKQKMTYASSKESLKRRLDGIYTEIQGTDAQEVSEEAVVDKV